MQAFLTIYAPINLTTDPCITVFMRASPLQGVLGPLGPTNIESSRAQHPDYWTWLHENHYAQKIYRCIGNFMSMSPRRFRARKWLRVIVGGGPN